MRCTLQFNNKETAMRKICIDKCDKQKVRDTNEKGVNLEILTTSIRFPSDQSVLLLSSEPERAHAFTNVIFPPIYKHIPSFFLAGIFSYPFSFFSYPFGAFAVISLLFSLLFSTSFLIITKLFAGQLFCARTQSAARRLPSTASIVIISNPSVGKGPCRCIGRRPPKVYTH